MTTYVLEMRSTANWSDVRYREYTTSAKKAEIFKGVPKVQFTDSGHGIVPSVREHKGRREPRNMMLQEHVLGHILSVSRKASAPKWSIKDDYKALLEAIDHTLTVHGHVDADTPLHERLRRTLALTN